MIVDLLHVINRETSNFTVDDGGVLHIVDNNTLKISQLIINENGTLHISQSTNVVFSFQPTFTITVNAGGCIKFDNNVILSTAMPENQITILSGAIIDFKGNWLSLNSDFFTLNRNFKQFPIVLQKSDEFDLSRIDNLAILNYNQWNIGFGKQYFIQDVNDLCFDLDKITFNLLKGIKLENDIILYGGQSLTRHNDAYISGNTTVLMGAIFYAGSRNLSYIDADKLKIGRGGRLVIDQIMDKNFDLAEKKKALIYWKDFNKIDFDLMSTFMTYALMKDDQNYVGSLCGRWYINISNQTAHFNSPKIASFQLSAGVNFYSPNLQKQSNYPTLDGVFIDQNQYSFKLYSSQNMALDNLANFHMDEGSKTFFEQGANIFANDNNVKIYKGAILETNGHRFSDHFIRPIWFQSGSTFNTLDVFYDDDKILPFVTWQIFSTKTPQRDLDFQEAYKASQNVQNIVIKSNAYVGIKKDTSFLLRERLLIENAGQCEILEGGEFAFVGGILKRDNSNYKITANYGARVTLASFRYALQDVLTFFTFDYGSILAFGDSYEPSNPAIGKPAYRGVSYSLDDDKFGLGLIPEHVSVEFNNGVQTLLNVQRRMRLIRFQNQGILGVYRDYPLSLYSGQVLDLNEADFDIPFSSTEENRYPYRMFIRSGAKLFLQAGARIIDNHQNQYTVLGVKAPITIKTDAKIMDDIPGINRWIRAIKSSVGINDINTLDDVSLDMFIGTHLDMDEFKTTKTGKFNYGANLQIKTTNTLYDNLRGVASIPFLTWYIGSKNNVYDQGQTIAYLKTPSNVYGSPLNYATGFGTSEFLKYIYIKDEAYVFSTSNYELKIGQCKEFVNLTTAPNFVDRKLKILKGGTLFISEDSLNAFVNDLYVCAGAYLVVDGKLYIPNRFVLETGAVFSGNGQIKYGTNGTWLNATSSNFTQQYQSPETDAYQHIDINSSKQISVTSDLEYIANSETNKTLTDEASYENPNFSNADFEIIEINAGGSFSFLADTYVVNNENALINIMNGGILTIDKDAHVKNLGDISAFKGGKIVSNSSYFQGDNILQSWFEDGAIFETTSDFDDGMGGIKSIPDGVEWRINADQTTFMDFFPPHKITVLSGKTLTLNSLFSLLANQLLTINGNLNLQANCKVLESSTLDVSNLNTISGTKNIILEAKGLLVNPSSNLATNVIANSGSYIKSTVVWQNFPVLNDASQNVEWQIASSSVQSVSAFPTTVSVIHILSGASTAITLTSVPSDKVLILDSGSTSTFTTSLGNPLVVEGELHLFKGAIFGTPYIKVVTGGKLFVDGDFQGLSNIQIIGGSLIGSNTVTDSAQSILSQIDDGEVFEIG